MLQTFVRHPIPITACAAVLFFFSAAPRRAHGTTMTTRLVVERFNEAFNRHDADALASLLTDDTVFEDTSPAPDGKRIEGKAAVTEYWRGWVGRTARESVVAAD